MSENDNFNLMTTEELLQRILAAAPEAFGKPEQRRVLMDMGGNRGPVWATINVVPNPAYSPVINQTLTELQRATRKFPTWPTDPLHALAVLGEEFGELTKAMLQLTYEPHKTNAEEVRSEAIQTAAMALRLAMSLERYQYRPSEQHRQQEGDGAGQ